MTRETPPDMPEMPVFQRENSSLLKTPLKDRSSTGLLLLTGFSSFFFFLLGLMLFSRGVQEFYKHFGYYSPTNEVHLWRFAAFSLLSFCFNLLFAVYFGLRFSDGLGRSALPNRSSSAEGSIFRILNWGLIGLLCWFFLFNLPTLLASVEFMNYPYLDLADNGRRPFIITWPPPSVPQPIRIEFMLFCALGNLGIFAGFSAGILLSEIRRLRMLARLQRH